MDGRADDDDRAAGRVLAFPVDGLLLTMPEEGRDPTLPVEGLAPLEPREPSQPRASRVLGLAPLFCMRF